MLAILHNELRCNFILADCVSTSSRSSEHLQLAGQNRSFNSETTADVDHNKGQKVKKQTNKHTDTQNTKLYCAAGFFRTKEILDCPEQLIWLQFYKISLWDQ